VVISRFNFLAISIILAISPYEGPIIYIYYRTIVGLWKSKSSAIEQREEHHEEDASSVDLD
jgi:hypothetical protein